MSDGDVVAISAGPVAKSSPPVAVPTVNDAEAVACGSTCTTVAACSGAPSPSSPSSATATSMATSGSRTTASPGSCDDGSASLRAGAFGSVTVSSSDCTRTPGAASTASRNAVGPGEQLHARAQQTSAANLPLTLPG